MAKTTSTLYLDVDSAEGKRRLADFEKQGNKIGNTFVQVGDRINKAFSFSSLTGNLGSNLITASARAVQNLAGDVVDLGVRSVQLGADLFKRKAVVSEP